MPRTLFVDSTPEIDKVWKRVHSAKDIPVIVNMGPVDEKDVPAKVAGYDTVINDATYFSAPTLERCKDLKHIVFLGTGAASFVDVAAARKLGIKVSTISGYGDTTVAEHAMGLVFAAARHIATMHGIVRSGGWRPMQGMELRGKTLGIVGLGGIGREMARIAGGIGLNVLAWNRTPRPDTVPIETLLETSSAFISRSTTRRAASSIGRGSARPGRASSS
jgi:D-3-phosphoglycerate dehydrogenase